MAKNKNNKKEQPKIAHPHLQMAQLFKECQWDKFLSLFNRFKSDPLVSKWAGHVPYALHGKLTDLLFRQKSPKNLIETANKLSEAAAGSDMVHLRDCAKIAADCLKVGTPGFAAAKLEQQSKLPPAWKKIRNLQSEYGQLVFGQQDDLRMSKIARLDALYRKPDKKPEHYWEMYQTGTELSELARFAGEKQVFEAMAEAAGILNDFSRDEVDDWRQPDSQAILSRVQKIARQSRHPAVKSLFMQVLETGLRIFGQTWFDAVKINLLKKYPQLDPQAAEVHQKFLTAKKTAPKGKLKNKMSADLDVLLSASIFSPQERYLLACLKSMLVFKTNFGSDDLLADPADGYISFFKKESAFKLGFSNFVDSVSQIERCAEAIGPEQLVWPKCVISCLSKLASVTPDLFSPLSRWSKNFSSFSDDILASFLLSLGEDEAAVRDYLSANNRLISNRKSEAMCFVQRWLAKDNPVSRRIVSEIGYFFERLDGIEKCFHPDAYKELLQDIVVNAVVSVFFSRLETLNDYYDPLRNKRFFEIFFENPEYFRSKVGDSPITFFLDGLLAPDAFKSSDEQKLLNSFDVHDKRHSAAASAMLMYVLTWPRFSVKFVANLFPFSVLSLDEGMFWCHFCCALARLGNQKQVLKILSAIKEAEPEEIPEGPASKSLMKAYDCVDHLLDAKEGVFIELMVMSLGGIRAYSGGIPDISSPFGGFPFGDMFDPDDDEDYDDEDDDEDYDDEEYDDEEYEGEGGFEPTNYPDLDDFKKKLLGKLTGSSMWEALRRLL